MRGAASPASMAFAASLDDCWVGVRRPPDTGLCSLAGLPSFGDSLVTGDCLSLSAAAARTVSTGGPYPRSDFGGVLLLEFGMLGPLLLARGFGVGAWPGGGGPDGAWDTDARGSLDPEPPPPGV